MDFFRSLRLSGSLVRIRHVTPCGFIFFFLPCVLHIFRGMDRLNGKLLYLYM
jgi:hypothetical protein